MNCQVLRDVDLKMLTSFEKGRKYKTINLSLTAINHADMDQVRPFLIIDPSRNMAMNEQRPDIAENPILRQA